MMRKTEMMVFRADKQHGLKLQQIQRQTGWKRSEVVRRIIEAADPTSITGLSLKANSDVNTGQGSHIAAAA